MPAQCPYTFTCPCQCLCSQLNLANNRLCGVYYDGYDEPQGTYTADGIMALSETLKVSASMTSLDISGNGIGGWGANTIAEGLKDNASLTSVR